MCVCCLVGNPQKKGPSLLVQTNPTRAPWKSDTWVWSLKYGMPIREPTKNMTFITKLQKLRMVKTRAPNGILIHPHLPLYPHIHSRNLTGGKTIFLFEGAFPCQVPCEKGGRVFRTKTSPSICLRIFVFLWTYYFFSRGQRGKWKSLGFGCAELLLRGTSSALRSPVPRNGRRRGSKGGAGVVSGVPMWLRLSKPMGSHFGVGEFTTHFRTYFTGDWDVHWGYGILTHGHIYAIFPFSWL